MLKFPYKLRLYNTGRYVVSRDLTLSLGEELDYMNRNIRGTSRAVKMG